MNLIRRCLLCGFPTLRNGVRRTRPPMPTSNVTTLRRSFCDSDARRKSSDVLITRILSAAVLGVAFGPGTEMTSTRSIGACGRGCSELDGPADMCGATSGVGELYRLSSSSSSSVDSFWWRPARCPSEPEPYDVLDDVVDRADPFSKLSAVLTVVPVVLPLSIRIAFWLPPNSSLSIRAAFALPPNSSRSGERPYSGCCCTEVCCC